MNRLATAPLPGTTVDPRYPDSDGRFMGETDYHSIAMTDARETLDVHFDSTPDVYVASNLVMYYRKGFPRLRKDPDILVAKGVGKHRRRSYRVWEEGCVPRTLIEIASGRTWRNDIDEKRRLYARLSIPEYFIFDPEGKYLDPVLRGFLTVGKKSVPMMAGLDGSLISEELGLKLIPEGIKIRFIDLASGEPIRSPRELAIEEAERAEQEAERAEQEAWRADREKRQREKLEAEIALLKARLAARDGKNGNAHPK